MKIGGKGIEDFLIETLLDTSPEVLAKVRDNELAAAPERLQEQDIPWTHKEVERAFVNGIRAAAMLPDTDRRMLNSTRSGHPSIIRDWKEGDDGCAMVRQREAREEQKERTDAHKHHIDQFEDLMVWMLGIPRPSTRKLVWLVAAQKAQGRINIDWHRILIKLGEPCHTPDLKKKGSDRLQKRYTTALRLLASRLTDMRYPRRLTTIS